MDKRIQTIHTWLSDELKLTITNFQPASDDASFRRYFRVTSDTQNYIIMDADPSIGDNQTTLKNYLYHNQYLETLGIYVPSIYHQNTTLGLLLLEDLGDETYLSQLNKSTADKLYHYALNSLLKIQQPKAEDSHQLNHYDTEKLLQEMNLFPQWFIHQHLQITLTDTQKQILKQTQTMLIEHCLEQPQVCVHRDFHSRNLMIGNRQPPAVIDFQDMVLGPICYDLASLFKDCYIQWPREQQIAWVKHYFQKIQTYFNIHSLEQFIRWYDFTGLQRHIKIMGIFCRLNYRDNKPRYMNDLPLVESYIKETCRLYPELENFGQLFEQLTNHA